MIAAAMLDRLLHRSVVLNISGDSYRIVPCQISQPSAN
jgi:DNA replication protein DnaC